MFTSADRLIVELFQHYCIENAMTTILYISNMNFMNAYMESQLLYSAKSLL